MVTISQQLFHFTIFSIIMLAVILQAVFQMKISKINFKKADIFKSMADVSPDLKFTIEEAEYLITKIEKENKELDALDMEGNKFKRYMLIPLLLVTCVFILFLLKNTIIGN